MERDVERGYTMVELMLTLLIIAVLIGIGLPTLLGARIRAQDRATQANIRNVFASEKVFYSDSGVYTEDVTALAGIEPSLVVVASDTPVAADTVYVHHHPATTEIYLSARSGSGMCFYLRDIPAGGTTFASSAGCGVTDTQTYGASW